MVAYQGKVMYCHDDNNGSCRRDVTECRFVHQKDPNWVDHPRIDKNKTRDVKKQKCGVPGCDMYRSAHSVKDCPVFAAMARPSSKLKDLVLPAQVVSLPAPPAPPAPKVKGEVAVPDHFDPLDFSCTRCDGSWDYSWYCGRDRLDYDLLHPSRGLVLATFQAPAP